MNLLIDNEIHNIDDKELLLNLKKYMLYDVYANKSKIEDRVHSEKGSGVKIGTQITDAKTPNIYVNYNKKKSKYYEKNEHQNTKAANKNMDKLFWCIYKIIHKYEDSDIEHLNFFKVEKDYKISIIEKIRANNGIFKKYKFKKNEVEDDIINNKTINLYTFTALCALYSINILIIKDNNTYSFLNYEENEENEVCDLFKANKLHIIFLNYKGTSSLKTNFELIMKNDLINLTNLTNILTTYYFVENINKPLKSLSSYKLGDLINISEIFKICIYTSANKKKTKNVLYEEISKILI
jgi:hypothetical protein